MYGILTVKPTANMDPSDADHAMGQFATSGLAHRIQRGTVEGCRLLTPHTFELTGSFVRAIAELQHYADTAKLTTELRFFTELPHTIETVPRPPRA